MPHLCSGDHIVPDRCNGPAKGRDGVSGGGQLLIGFHGFHGQELPAGPHQGQAQLAQHRQGSHRPGDRQVIGFPVGAGKFLRPAVDAGYIREAQLPADRLQKLDALAQGVQQRQPDGGLQDPQGQAGEAGAGAHVHDGFAVEVLQRQQGGAVQKVEGSHVPGLCDSGEVHHLVGLQQQLPIPAQGGDPVRRKPHGRQTGLQILLHHVLSFSRSRISVSSCSSREGWGGGGGASSSFL